MATGQLALLPDEEVRHVQPATAMHLGAGASANAPVGTLYVTTRRVAWLQDGAGSPPSGSELKTFSYPSIGMHAVCSDPSDFPAPCLYLQIDASLDAPALPGDSAPSGRGAHAPRESGLAQWLNGPPADGAAAGGLNGGEAGGGAMEGGADAEGEGGAEEAAEEEAEEGDGDLAEVRLVPADPSALETLFQAMSSCAALHPCGGDEDDDDEDDDDEYGGGGGGAGYGALAGGALPAGFFTGEGGGLSDAQQAMLDHFDSVLADPGDVIGGAEEGGADGADGGAAGEHAASAMLQGLSLLAGDPGRFEDAEAAAGGAEGHARQRMED